MEKIGFKSRINMERVMGNDRGEDNEGWYDKGRPNDF